MIFQLIDDHSRYAVASHVATGETAEPPRPKPDRPIYQPPVPVMNPRLKPPADLPAGTVARTVATSGTITLDSVRYRVGPRRAFEQVLIITDGDQPGDTIIIADLLGEVLAEHVRPAPGIRYVGNGRRPQRRTQPDEPSPKS